MKSILGFFCESYMCKEFPRDDKAGQGEFRYILMRQSKFGFAVVAVMVVNINWYYFFTEVYLITV